MPQKQFVTLFMTVEMGGAKVVADARGVASFTCKQTAVKSFHFPFQTCLVLES